MTLLDEARRLYAADLTEWAESACAQALRSEPREPAALHLMGLIRFRQDRLDEAAFLLAASAALAESSCVSSDLGCVHLAQRRPGEAVPALEHALDLDPGNAQAWCLLGHAYAGLDDAATAIRCYARAASLDPDNAEAHAHLGVLRAAAGQPEQAIAAYRAAVAADPARAEAWNNLGALLEGEEALACFDSALRSRPAFADAHFNRGNALRALDRLEEAAASYEQALAGGADAASNLAGTLLELNRPHEAESRYARAGGPQARFGEALALLVSGDLRRGFELYEARLLDPAIGTGRHAGIPRWGGQDPRGRTIVVHEEQGIGDTVQCLRYVPLLAQRGARVIAEVRVELLELAQSLDRTVTVVPLGGTLPRCDYQVAVMSLPHAFGTTLDTIPAQVPYLRPPSLRTESWTARLPTAEGRLRVGIAWAGSTAFAGDARRSMPVAAVAPLLERTDCRFHVLQTGLSTADRVWLRAHPDVHNAGAEFVDIADTAGVAGLMDLVISVDTSVAHIAGALGRPVWLMLPHAPDWRWLLDRTDSPWYPTARLFRQHARGDWAEVIERIGEALDEIV